MPIFFGAVLTLSFLLLMVVFRSLLVPLKAVIMNLLSIARGLRRHRRPVPVGLAAATSPSVQPGPIETWVPMMLFAVVFGLSMDYEVFLLSRIREEWRRTGDSRTSVADGLAATAKVITAAAAIMVVVFGSFMLEFERTMKMMGTGLAVAILFDATIVRMVLVPGDDGAARRPQLVAAALARPDPARTSTSRATPTRPHRSTTTSEDGARARPHRLTVATRAFSPRTGDATGCLV